jgi:hypothetical protein
LVLKLKDQKMTTDGLQLTNNLSVVSPVTTNDKLISELWIKTEQEKML